MMIRLFLMIAGLCLIATPIFGEVKQEVCKLSMSEIKAKQTVAFISKGATYDKEKTELTFTVNNASGKAFRLVYDSTKVLALIEGAYNTTTSTIHAIEEFDTEKQALDRIKVLGLKYTVH